MLLQSYLLFHLQYLLQLIYLEYIFFNEFYKNLKSDRPQFCIL